MGTAVLGIFAEFYISVLRFVPFCLFYILLSSAPILGVRSQILFILNLKNNGSNPLYYVVPKSAF